MMIEFGDAATWVSGVFMAASAGLAWFALRAQRAATRSADEAAKSADRVQRLQFRPALIFSWREEPILAVNAPATIWLCVRNVGHGTAIIERVRLLEFGNVRVDYSETHGNGEQLLETFDVELFQRMAGVRLDALPARADLLKLNDQTRALEVGAEAALFTLIEIPNAHATRVIDRFHDNVKARVTYRALSGDEFDTDDQFGSLRRGGAA